jgi:hypothetical protein
MKDEKTRDFHEPNADYIFGLTKGAAVLDCRLSELVGHEHCLHNVEHMYS